MLLKQLSLKCGWIWKIMHTDIPLRTFSSKVPHIPGGSVLAHLMRTSITPSSQFLSGRSTYKKTSYSDQCVGIRNACTGKRKGCYLRFSKSPGLANAWKSHTSERKRRKCQSQCFVKLLFQFHCVCGGEFFLLPSLTSTEDRPSGVCIVSLPQFQIIGSDDYL